MSRGIDDDENDGPEEREPPDEDDVEEREPLLEDDEPAIALWLITITSAELRTRYRKWEVFIVPLLRVG